MHAIFKTKGALMKYCVCETFFFFDDRSHNYQTCLRLPKPSTYNLIKHGLSSGGSFQDTVFKIAPQTEGTMPGALNSYS